MGTTATRTQAVAYGPDGNPAALVTRAEVTDLVDGLKLADGERGDWRAAIGEAFDFAVGLAERIRSAGTLPDAITLAHPGASEDGPAIYTQDDEPTLATHWYYALGERWVAVNEATVSLDQWWGDDGITPETWMKRPIALTPQFGTLVYVTTHPGTGNPTKAVETSL